MLRILILTLLVSQIAYSQQANFWSRSELGINFGQMYYIGELNPYIPFYKSQNAFGAMYRLNRNARMSYRFNYLYGSLAAYDSDSKITQHVNRNLNFKSNIHEISGGVEFYFKSYQLGNDRYRETFYFLAQVGMFYMNPKTEYNGEWVALQPLGTEGQTGKKRYNNYQLCIPIGMGYKFSIGKIMAFNIDLSIRKTFTDYIDDIGANIYATEDAFVNHDESELSYALSNRTLDGSRTERRGNKSTRDWYVYGGASITIKLGNGNTCWDFK
jgi:hypothetical protein